jgi:hypothetical protein
LISLASGNSRWQGTRNSHPEADTQLIAFGIALIFVQIRYGDLIYSILGLVMFAGLTMVDFQRLRRATDIESTSRCSASHQIQDSTFSLQGLLRNDGSRQDCSDVSRICLTNASIR